MTMVDIKVFCEKMNRMLLRKFLILATEVYSVFFIVFAVE